jgi:hypothetical protein
MSDICLSDDDDNGQCSRTNSDLNANKKKKKNKRKKELESSSYSSSSLACAATNSSPVTSHFDSVMECLDFMRMVENDENMEKKDVINAVRGMLHNMLSKILLNNSTTSMSMMGWKLEQ